LLVGRVFFVKTDAPHVVKVSIIKEVVLILAINSSVGIVTRLLLDCQGVDARSPEGARDFSLLRTVYNVCGAHLSFCTKGTGVCIPNLGERIPEV
jgi:hypothetical protein